MQDNSTLQFKREVKIIYVEKRKKPRQIDGGSMLCLERFMYTKTYTRGERIRWEYSQRRAYSFVGGLSTDIEVCTFEK